MSGITKRKYHGGDQNELQKENCVSLESFKSSSQKICLSSKMASVTGQTVLVGMHICFIFQNCIVRVIVLLIIKFLQIVETFYI